MQKVFFRLQTIVLLAVLFLAYGVHAFAAAGPETASEPGWTAPSAMAVKRLGPISSAQHEPSYLENLDCVLVDYRMVGTNDARRGCFTMTSYGLYDMDTQVIIYTGTDEAVKLLPGSTYQIPVPWQHSSEILSLNSVGDGGASVSVYRNGLVATSDVRNAFGILTAKQITAPTDYTLYDGSGTPLVVNISSVAYSSNGSWLVAQKLYGNFIRINLATHSVQEFSAGFYSASTNSSYQVQLTVSDDGQFVAINNNQRQSTKVFNLHSCNDTVCASYDYRSFIAQNISTLQQIRHLRFVNDGLLIFETQETNKAGSTYEFAPTNEIRYLTDYLGLGDSYSSGEGAFDYRPGTDTAEDQCHQSVHSYPLLLREDLFSASGGNSVACSGARIRDISGPRGYRGQVRGAETYDTLTTNDPQLLSSIFTNYLPGYIAQSQFVTHYLPQKITVSIGGNDMGFGDILVRCIAPHITSRLSSQTCYNTYEDRLEVKQSIDRMVTQWTALYRQLSNSNPGMSVYAVGYPSIASDTGRCGLNVLLSKSELEFSEEIIDYLNATMSKAATSAGVQYVDIYKALYGHRLCETASSGVAVNGLTAGTAVGVSGLHVIGKESYHPNMLGQELIEQAILKQTKNLTSGSPATTNDGTKLTDAPKTGRTVYTTIYTNSSGQFVLSGDSVHVTVPGGSGLSANTQYTIHIGGPSGPTIGQTISDNSGGISVDAPIPTSTPPGGSTIDITGGGQGNNPVDVIQPIIIPVHNSDTDGDGIPDATDSCPIIVNSGIDEDRDGIDDACDNQIGGTTGTTQPGDGGSGSQEQIIPESTIVDPQVSTSMHTTDVTLLGIQKLLTNATLKPITQNQTSTAKNSSLTVSKPDSYKKAALVMPAGAPQKIRGTPSPLHRLQLWYLLALAIFWWLLLCVGMLARSFVAQQRSDNKIVT